MGTVRKAVLPGKQELIADIETHLLNIKQGRIKAKFCKFNVGGSLLKVHTNEKSLTAFLENVKHCPVHGETPESGKAMLRRARNNNWTQKRIYIHVPERS